MKKLILTCLLASCFLFGTVVANPHSTAEYQQVFTTDNQDEHKAAIANNFQEKKLRNYAAKYLKTYY
jgi:uncharacterized protein YfcZ (UPF0381/DUF406 family)